MLSFVRTSLFLTAKDNKIESLVFVFILDCFRCFLFSTCKLSHTRVFGVITFVFGFGFPLCDHFVCWRKTMEFTRLRYTFQMQNWYIILILTHVWFCVLLTVFLVKCPMRYSNTSTCMFSYTKKNCFVYCWPWGSHTDIKGQPKRENRARAHITWKVPGLSQRKGKVLSLSTCWCT